MRRTIIINMFYAAIFIEALLFKMIYGLGGWGEEPVLNYLVFGAFALIPFLIAACTTLRKSSHQLSIFVVILLWVTAIIGPLFTGAAFIFGHGAFFVLLLGWVIQLISVISASTIHNIKLGYK